MSLRRAWSSAAFSLPNLPASSNSHPMALLLHCGRHHAGGFMLQIGTQASLRKRRQHVAAIRLHVRGPLRILRRRRRTVRQRSEEHTSELQSLMRISYAVFCLNKNQHTLKLKTKKKQE